jgi:sialate O-acetylesterase
MPHHSAVILVFAFAAGTTMPAAAAAAGFALSNLFSDAMVLQAEAPTLFGTCTSACQIHATITGGASASVRCAATGQWKLVFPGRPASDPTKPGTAITVMHSCGQEKEVGTRSTPAQSTVLRDVLFGDVWVCGGQSNMVSKQAALHRQKCRRN